MPVIGLDQTCAVYTRDANGVYNVLETDALVCRIVQVRNTSADASSRATFSRMRRLLWEPSYIMPGYAQIEIDSGVGVERWNVVAGSENAPRGPWGPIYHRSVDLVRAEL